MDAITLQDWVQIVGLLSVVASLIFVGLQLRQAEKTAVMETYANGTQNVLDWHVAMASNQSAMSAIRKSIEGKREEISPEEFDSAFFMISGILQVYDHSFFRYEQGYLAEDHWQLLRTHIKDDVKIPIVRYLVVKRIKTLVRPSLRDELVKLLGELDAETAASESPLDER